MRLSIVLAALASTCIASAAAAGSSAAPPLPPPSQCSVPDDVALIEGPLPRLASRLRAREPATIVVLGSGSAAGSGTSRPEASFPFRLTARLAIDHPRAKWPLVVLAQTGQTAPAMQARIAQEVLPLRPALVIWQTGAADVGHGVSVADVSAALDRGIAELHAHGSDVVLVDGQFSPRASLMVNTDAYREAVRWTARRDELPLLRRYATMAYWSEHDAFDLDAEDKADQLANADRIHDCVAALLTTLIRHGIAADPRP